MKKIVALFFALATGVASAQVEIDVPPTDLLSGEADARLREIGAQAVEENLPVTVTAPAYWHEMIAEQIRAGANGEAIELTLRETLIENVIIRIGGVAPKPPAASREAPEAAATPQAVDAGPAPVAPEAPSTETRETRKAAQERLRQEAEKNVTRAPDSKSEVPTITPDVRPANPAEVMGTAPSAEGGKGDGPDTRGEMVKSAREQQEPPPEQGDVITGVDSLDEAVEEHAEQPTRSTPRPDPADAEVDSPGDVVEAPEPKAASVSQEAGMSSAEARASLEERLNDGRPITKTLSLAQLRRGDQLFVTAGEAAVVRRTRVGRNIYWLDGRLDTEAEELRRIRAGKYEVLRRLDVEEPEAPAPLAAEEAERREVIEADAFSDERSEMEARYNQGRPIESTLSPSGLRTNDILYVGDDLIVVIRRDKVSLKRYWLVGDLDLERDELERLGSRKYRVRRSIR